MKKALSLVLALAMLFTCALSSAAFAEEGPVTPQEKELAQVVQWLVQDIPAEEMKQFFTWDRDTILQKLEAYDQPLEYSTKEEIADQLSFFTALAGMLVSSAENGEGLMDFLGGLLGGTEESGESGLSGLLSLFGGADVKFGGEEAGDDWAYEGIVSIFDGTFWESGELKMEIVFQDGYYKAAIQDGERELSYLCEYDEFEEDDRSYDRLTGIGTGDEEMDAAQPDRGRAEFIWNYWTQELTWQRDGEKIVFTQIIDPLDESTWVGSGKTLRMRWLGDLNYELTIEQPDFISWHYQCVLNEETGALEGVGAKTKYSKQVYTDAQASFALNEARTHLTWTDEKEPDAAEGLTLDAAARDVLLSFWRGENYVLVIFDPDGYGRYDLHVFEDEMTEEAAEPEETAEAEQPDESEEIIAETERTEYAYLCTYDWEKGVFTAIDPSAIDFDSLMLYADPELYKSTAVFTLEDGQRILWQDDSGLTGESGIVLEKSEF